MDRFICYQNNENADNSSFFKIQYGQIYINLYDNGFSGKAALKSNMDRFIFEYRKAFANFVTSFKIQYGQIYMNLPELNMM